MLDFARKTFLGLTAALAMGAAIPAGAATFGGGGWSGTDPSCNVTGSFADNSSNINVLAGANFNSTFADGEAGGNMCFNFSNTSASTAVVTLAVATVNQGGESWGFLGGVKLFSEQAGPLPLWEVAQGVFGVQQFTFTLAALETIFFDWTYGEAYASAEFNLPQINFTVSASPVPLPAGGLLLIGALGGLAALRRRKSAA
jgi:hypothetical protein